MVMDKVDWQLMGLFKDVKEVCCVLMFGFGIGWADAKPLELVLSLNVHVYRCERFILFFNSYTLFLNASVSF